HDRLRLMEMEARPGFDCIVQSHVTRQDNYGNATPRDRGLHGNLKHAGHLFRMRNQLAIVAALREKMFRVGLLEVPAAYLIAWNLRRDGQDGHAAAVAVVESVDQVQVSGAATSRANRQPTGKMGLRARRKGCRLFVPKMDPIQLSCRSNRLGNAVERVTGNTV